MAGEHNNYYKYAYCELEMLFEDQTSQTTVSIMYNEFCFWHD